MVVDDPKLPTPPKLAPRPPELSDHNWTDGLNTVDRTYTDQIGYQKPLEQQNTELEVLRQLLCAIPSTVTDILVASIRHGVVEEISVLLTLQTGLALVALVGRYVSDLFDRANREALEAAMHRVETARMSVTLKLGLLTAEGVASPLQVKLSSRPDDRGRVVGMVLSGRRMGELRQAYADLVRRHDALKATQTQLVRGEKLASLGRLLARVAHELNNPISFVYPNTHVLGKSVGRFESYYARVQAGKLVQNAADALEGWPRVASPCVWEALWAVADARCH